MSINVKRCIKRGQNKSSTGQSPEQPGLSSLPPVPLGAGDRIRGLQRSLPTSTSLRTTPEAVQRPAAARTVACPSGQRDNLPVGSVCHDTGARIDSARTHALPRETRKLSLAPRQGPCSSSSGPPLSSWRGGGTCLQLAPHCSTVPGKGPEKEGERKAG